MKSKQRKKVVKKTKAYGILNQFGDFWTPNIFMNILDAEQYKIDFWRKIQNKPNMSEHQVVPVSVTITYTITKESK